MKHSTHTCVEKVPDGGRKHARGEWKTSKCEGRIRNTYAGAEAIVVITQTTNKRPCGSEQTGGEVLGVHAKAERGGDGPGLGRKHVSYFIYSKDADKKQGGSHLVVDETGVLINLVR